MTNPPNPAPAPLVPANAVVWFRRDIRFADNGAIRAAAVHVQQTGGRVWPVFVLDHSLINSSGPNRLAYLYRALRSLRTIGVPLDVIDGPAAAVVEYASSRSAAVFVTADAGPIGHQRDQQISDLLVAASSALIPADSPYLVSPGTVRKGDGTPFKVFTPFSRVWLNTASRQRPSPIPQVAWANSEGAGSIPADPSDASTLLPNATEAGAMEQWIQFAQDHLRTYDTNRDLPGLDATSRLGAAFKFGLLHPRQVLGDIEAAIDQGSEGARVFRSELCWREFYADVLWHRPESRWNNYVSNMDIDTDSGPTADERFDAWCQGRTGFPFIDAGMRQLLAEGWMHNRVRMAAASFLVKDLHLPWQRGAAWFMKHLVDGDVASNQHGWQWTAGTGTDAAPYFRIFNPVSQGKRFDPTGTYVRRWIPELQSMSDRFIHEPWLVAPTASTLFEGGSTAVGSYPAPIVDHATERDEAMRRYRATRSDS
jgi:deoxyribodipyrimidine photo-lyase